MCGIAGLMTSDGRRPDSAALDRLEAALAHRGPDGSGRYISRGTGLVSTRLAIIDLRTGMQPIYGEQGAALVANGEIYNDLELRAKMRDVCFKTGSDCESALHLYRRKGLDFVQELRGMYAIAIHDPVTSRLVLARDPFGIKPLYYVKTPTYFAFASEPQALLAAGLADRTIQPRARAELFQLKFTTGSQTIFPQIRRVLPGETLVVAHGQIVERRQRDALPPDGPRRLSYSQALQQLDEVLTDSLVHHIRSDVPYGLFLSGGVDSSTLLRLMARFSSEVVVALTAYFPGTRAVDERADAERIARFVGAAHHVVEMTERDFWSDAPKVAQALDDPTTDAATLPTFVLGKAAKGLVKVVLSGEGGDEMFCGYSRYRRARWLHGMFTRNARTRGEFEDLGDMNGTFDGWRDGLNRNEREIACDRPWTFVQRLQAVDCAQWLPNDLLIKLDRCLMAHGIEGRTPFLDPVVADFAFHLADDQKATTKMSKRILRDWLAKNAPAARPYANKTGFNPPVGEWIAARKSLVESMVSAQPGIAEAFTNDDVHRVFHDPVKNPQAAWSLLFYALWHSHHVLGNSRGGTVVDVLDAARHLG